jgi:hypothetical protein
MASEREQRLNEYGDAVMRFVFEEAERRGVSVADCILSLAHATASLITVHIPEEKHAEAVWRHAATLREAVTVGAQLIRALDAPGAGHA